MPDSLTTDRIRRRLAGTRIPADPLAVDFTHMGNPMPEALVERLRPSLRAAGVLIPIVNRPDAPSVLLTERSAHLKHHAGQVSFPGGGMEDHDEDIVATALRETQEEVGIGPGEIDIAGYLEPVATITGYAITCVIGLVEPTIRLVRDPVEVEEIFEVPLAFLMDRGNAEMTERVFEGIRIPVATYHYEGHRIWGATAGMLVTLSELLLEPY